MSRLSPRTAIFPRVLHAIFGDGLLIDRRIGDSGRDLSDCIFLDGSAPRTILSEYLILFTESRQASLQERRGIARWKSKQPTKPVPEPDANPDSELSEAKQDEVLALAEVVELHA